MLGKISGERRLNLAIVKAGQAAVYDRYCSDGRYPMAERQARQEEQGVWVEPGCSSDRGSGAHVDLPCFSDCVVVDLSLPCQGHEPCLTWIHDN
ncbi:hypothetical protein [Halomonas sp.]|uniref:hypothetical protein n=1 Tax=Halomonas sp. TaxID=1486246 RepID=UPI00338EF12C